jgi:hypothetical protein
MNLHGLEVFFIDAALMKHDITTLTVHMYFTVLSGPSVEFGSGIGKGLYQPLQ